MTWTERLATVARDRLGLEPETLFALASTAAVILAVLALRGLAGWVLSRRVGDPTRRYLVGKSLDYVLGFVALLILGRLWLGAGSGMGAYLGVLSAGLAIALQDPLTNLAGWLFITIRRPFSVGDRVEIGEHAGDVIDVRLFAFSVIEIGNWVHADQSTGRIIHIPNGWVFQKAVGNYTAGFTFVWHEIPVVVTFESAWRDAKRILGEIAARHAAIRSEAAAEEVRRAARKYLIFYKQLTPIVWTRVVDHGVELTLRYPTHARQRRSTEERIWEDVLDAFAEHPGIDFAYPTWRIYDRVREAEPEPGGGGSPPGGGRPTNDASRYG